jgi:hypothetical protein
LETLYKYLRVWGFGSEIEMHLESDRGAPSVSCALSTVNFLLSR